MRLPDDQVRTEEVRNWNGVHLLHFQDSSCSQKVRILLSEKGIPWTPHPVNLARFENTRPWFLGINPRGVVPVLVHDGAVHVESNDIMEYLDEHLPSDAQPFFPRDGDERRLVADSLDLENSLHVDLRTITMGFMVPKALATKSPKTLAAYQRNGALDARRETEVAWWRAFAKDGVTPAQARRSFRAFQAAFEGLEARLKEAPWLIGNRISVLEIAWFISMRRLVLAGYPLERHPHLRQHYEQLCHRPSFARETKPSGLSRLVLSGYRLYRKLGRKTLLEVTEWSGPANGDQSA
jgi:glutathione S-transferase